MPVDPENLLRRKSLPAERGFGVDNRVANLTDLIVAPWTVPGTYQDLTSTAIMDKLGARAVPNCDTPHVTLWECATTRWTTIVSQPWRPRGAKGNRASTSTLFEKNDSRVARLGSKISDRPWHD